MDDLIAVDRQLIGDKGVEVDGGVVFVGVDIQALAPGNRAQLLDGSSIILTPVAEVPQQAACQTDAGGMEHKAVVILHPGAHADVNAGGKVGLLSQNLRVEGVDAFHNDDLTGLAVNRDGLVAAALTGEVKGGHFHRLAVSHHFQMLPQQGHIDDLGGFVVDLTFLVLGHPTVGTAEIIVVHGQGVAGMAVVTEILGDTACGGGFSAARRAGQQYQRLALLGGLQNLDGSGLYLGIITLLAPADKLGRITGGFVHVGNLEIVHRNSFRKGDACMPDYFLSMR